MAIIYNVATIRNNVEIMWQRYVALKIVVASVSKGINAPLGPVYMEVGDPR